jgi:hypothetical protein
VLAHSILAMNASGTKPLKVKCNTCGGEHNYRADKPTPKTPAAKKDDVKKVKKTSTRKPKKSWEDTLKDAREKPETHKKYAMSGSFAEGDWIDHAKFGLGQVQTFVPPNKINVRFADEMKLLVCNQSQG